MGCRIDINKVPIKYDMDPCDILISESQERMLIVAHEKNLEDISNIFKKWDLEYAVIGQVNLLGKYSVYYDDTLLYSKDMDSFSDISEDWDVSIPMDVDYGKYLQYYFLNNSKIKYIFESKIERFFQDADVNTSITILEKTSQKNKRDNNIIKFVQFRKMLPKVLNYFGAVL